jgi:hypothetical protein
VLFAAFGRHAGDPGYVAYLDYNGDAGLTHQTPPELLQRA